MKRSVFDQRLEFPYGRVIDVKMWIKLQIANCTREGGLIGAVSLSNTGLFYPTSLFVLHFFF